MTSAEALGLPNTKKGLYTYPGKQAGVICPQDLLLLLLHTTMFDLPTQHRRRSRAPNTPWIFLFLFPTTFTAGRHTGGGASKKGIPSFFSSPEPHDEVLAPHRVGDVADALAGGGGGCHVIGGQRRVDEVGLTCKNIFQI